MWITKFFKRKKDVIKPEPKVFEGKVVTDEEIKKMQQSNLEPMFKKDIDEMNLMVKQIKDFYGRQ